MEIAWENIRLKARKYLKTSGLAVAGITALYIGALQPLRSARGIAEQRATGLGQGDSLELSQKAKARSRSQRLVADGIIGGIAEESANLATVAEPAFSSPQPQEDADLRKTIRTASLDLVVQRPAETAEKIRQLAEKLGGFLESSQVGGDQDAISAALTIRVPFARFEEARVQIRKLGLRVESERVDAQDVTRQYVDQEARLRNSRAEEAQYLAILKHASTVKDTLEVSEKLSGVRGEIEQQQAEFDALSKQVETVAITVSLRAEADAQVFGLYWRPVYRLKLALRGGLNGLADYASIMASVLLSLPAVLLWLTTILLGAALAYRILRWAMRALFTRAPAVAPNS